jgi:hypothetical protein
MLIALIALISLIALALLGAAMLTCTTSSARRSVQRPTPLCLEQFKEVAVLLQAGQPLEARARAVLIRSEQARSQALKLIEHSRAQP